MKTNNLIRRWAAVISASIRGASHARSGSCCQDAVSVKEGSIRGEPYLICAVADGHGGDAYTHSERGAVLAVLAAEQVLTQFLLKICSRRKRGSKRFERHVAACIRDAWIEQIRQSCGSLRIPYEVVRRHGSTLLIALFFRDHLYMAQLGDGTLCVIDHEGVPSFAVKPEDGLVTNAADSLCCLDAEYRWIFACRPLDSVRTLMMSTDGLINALATTHDYVKLANTLDDNMRRVPVSQINRALPEWLETYSQHGSGDDISLVTVTVQPKTTNQGEYS